MKRSSSTRQLRRLLSILALPAAIQPAAASPGTDKTYIIATPGGATPDGQNTIYGPSIFALSERGLVYRAKSVTSGVDVLYSVRRSGTREILREGTVMPGVGTIAWMLGQMATNNGGEAVVIVGIRNAAGVEKEALVAGTSPQDLRVVAMVDQPVPGGSGQFNSFSQGSINELGQVGFWASIKNGGGPIFETNGVYLSQRDGTLVQVVRNKQQVPGEAYNFASIDSSGLVEGLGQVHFSGFIRDAYYGTGYNQAHYRREPLGSITRLFRSRQPAPGTPYFFGSPGGLGTHYSGRYAVYTTLIDAANSLAGWGIFTGSDDEHLSPVAFTGQTAPSGAGTYASFSQTATVNLAGKVAYVGNCTGGNTSSALFTYRNGEQNLVCKAGQVSPGGNTFSGFDFPIIKDSGTILFAARLNGSQTYQGIYLTDGTDIIKVAQAGDTVGGRTIQSIGIDPKAFNGFNQVAYQAELSGGQSGPSVLLFAPRLKWRGLVGGAWENAFNWTVSLVPSDYNDVDIIPPDPIEISGPLEDTTVGKLTIGTQGEGLTDCNLKSGIVTAVAGVNLTDGGMLSGAGAIVGNVSNASVLSPGNSPGLISITGNYDQVPSGSLVVEVTGATVGQYDHLQVTGDVSLAGTLDVKLLGSAINELRADSEIPFLTATGQITGQFAGFPDGSRIQVAGGLASFAISYRDHAVALADFQTLDSDSDGMPDHWMIANFGHAAGDAADNSSADSDADGDGATNRDEYLAGTHPGNGTEFFAAVVTAVDPASLTIAFPSVAGRSYGIDYSGNPGSWITIRSGIEGDGSEKSITVERDGENRRGFYRVSVSR